MTLAVWKVQAACINWAVQMSCQSHCWRNRQKVAAPLEKEGEENKGHNRTIGSTHQQSWEEAISCGKFQGTEPGRGKRLKRQIEKQGLAMADVRNKWKAEEGLRMKQGEVEGDQAHLLCCILF